MLNPFLDSAGGCCPGAGAGFCFVQNKFSRALVFLVLQEGNDPLDIGLNALDTVEKSKGGRGVKSELSVSGFALRLGKKQQDISKLMNAGTVLRKLKECSVGFESDGRAFHLFEIHAAPESTGGFKKVSAQADGFAPVAVAASAA